MTDKECKWQRLIWNPAWSFCCARRTQTEGGDTFPARHPGWSLRHTPCWPYMSRGVNAFQQQDFDLALIERGRHRARGGCISQSRMTARIDS